MQFICKVKSIGVGEEGIWLGRGSIKWTSKIYSQFFHGENKPKLITHGSIILESFPTIC